MTTRGKAVTSVLITLVVATGLYLAVKKELEPVPGPQTRQQRRRMNRPSYYMRRQRT